MVLRGLQLSLHNLKRGNIILPTLSFIHNRLQGTNEYKDHKTSHANSERQSSSANGQHFGLLARTSTRHAFFIMFGTTTLTTSLRRGKNGNLSRRTHVRQTSLTERPKNIYDWITVVVTYQSANDPMRYHINVHTINFYLFYCSIDIFL